MSPRVRPVTSPRPAQVLSLRLAAALTQREAAGLLHTTDRVWRQWEAGDRHMHPAFWELFQLKAAGAEAQS